MQAQGFDQPPYLPTPLSLDLQQVKLSKYNYQTFSEFPTFSSSQEWFHFPPPGPKSCPTVASMIGVDYFKIPGGETD